LQVPSQPASIYLWSTDSLMTDTIGIGTLIAVDSIQSDSIFYVQITNANACSNIGSTTVQVSAGPPPPDICGDSILCEGEELRMLAFDGSGLAATYLWTGPSGFTANTNLIVISATTTNNAGLYTAYNIDASGCMSVAASVNVIISPLPSTPVLTADSVCSGDPIIVVSTVSCDSTVWQGDLGTTISGTGDSLVIPPATLAYGNSQWEMMWNNCG
jgi:hypothetical protein